MEQQLRLWLQQQFELSNDYASWAAITGVIVLILAIAVILHLTLHKGLLPYIERRTGGAQRPWGALITRTRLFNRFAFLIQGWDAALPHRRSSRPAHRHGACCSACCCCFP